MAIFAYKTGNKIKCTMKKINLKRSPELFQGEKLLYKNKNYFEGWYYKITDTQNGIALIPGITVSAHNKHAFIQVLTPSKSYYLKFDLDDFEYSNNPFFIKIKNNFFSKEKIVLNLEDKEQEICIKGELKFSNFENIKTSVLSPNIMGPLSYFPFLECNHAILLMNSSCSGALKINGKKIKFKHAHSYIEKDFGKSFPHNYIWCQGNTFDDKTVSFMFATACVPFMFFKIRGLICSIIINNKEYRFATYNFARIKEITNNEDKIKFTLKKGKFILEVKCICNNPMKLQAPKNGNMTKEVFESLTSIIKVTLKENDKVLYSGMSTNCGCEIVLK